jgi:hypothetical protein
LPGVSALVSLIGNRLAERHRIRYQPVVTLRGLQFAAEFRGRRCRLVDVVVIRRPLRLVDDRRRYTVFGGAETRSLRLQPAER